MPNLILLCAILTISITQCFGVQKCGDIGLSNSTYSIVYLKKALPADNECSHDLEFKYIYEGPATLWTRQNKDPFLYIDIPGYNDTTCYFVLLREHSMKRCYVQKVWKATEKLIVFETQNPTKEGFVGDVSKHLKQGCTNLEKVKAFFAQCLYYRVLPIQEYSAHIKLFYEEEKIHYQLHAFNSHRNIQMFNIRWITSITLLLLCLIYS